MTVSFPVHRKNTSVLFISTAVVVLLLMLVTSCTRDFTLTPAAAPESDLTDLPEDTGGVHTPVYYDSGSNPYGYYIYVPSGYGQNRADYPLLVFLHGAGERGNSMADTSVLKYVLVNGPPSLIQSKKWAPRYPMIVVSPQCNEWWWDASKIDRLISLIVQNCRVNDRRIYMTGLSLGGYGTYSYIETYSGDGYVAAAVPICGGGNPSLASKYLDTPIWAFHGEADSVVPVSNSIDMVQAINELSPAVRAKLTLYPGVGHNSWAITYDGSGMGKEDENYDPFDISIYDWMFEYTK